MSRETLDVDVLYVGGGISALASSLHLADLIGAHNRAVEAGTAPGRKLDEPQICVIEKGAHPGAHAFSGAVMDPAPLRELLGEEAYRALPVEAAVADERVYFLTASGALRYPVLPRQFRNAGHAVVSLAKLAGALGELAEARGVMVLPGFAGVEILRDGAKVTGVATGDKGINPDGTRKPNFEPGNDIRAGVTVFAEGSRGSLTRRLVHDFRLAGRFPQGYELGVKEVLELPEGRTLAGSVWHGSGFPLDGPTGGGWFFYGMGGRLVTLGIAGSLDTVDPLLDMHAELQKLKTHPLFAETLAGAKTVHYGGKTLSAGGYYTIPRPVVDGALLIGESAGLLNPEKLKGIHLAVRSGMLAARTILKCLLARDFSAKMLGEYEAAVRAEIVEKELRRCRNFHGAIGAGSTLRTFFHLGLQEVTGGRGLADPLPLHEDHTRTRPLAETHPAGPPAARVYDNAKLLDKLTDVYLTGTTHEEHQPCHLRIGSDAACADCFGTYGAPCTHFCPAQVYELETAGGARKLKINFTNCIHCKSCDIKCPAMNITWTCPEGGGGPKYTVQ